MTFGFRRAEILSAQANAITLLVLGAADRRRRRCSGSIVAARRRRAAGRRRPRSSGAAVNVVAIWQVAPREPREPERRGQLPAPRSPTSSRSRRRSSPAPSSGHRLRSGRPDRVARRRGVDARRGLPLLRRTGARAARGGARGDATRARSRARSRRIPGSRAVHDLHVWEISSRLPGPVGPRARRAGRGLPPDPARARAGCSHERFGLDHTTLQVEHTSDRLLSIAPLRTDRADR